MRPWGDLTQMRVVEWQVESPLGNAFLFVCCSDSACEVFFGGGHGLSLLSLL